MIAKRRWLALGLAAIAGLAQACLRTRDAGFTAQGLVVDGDGRPAPGVTVKARGQPTMTDGHGCFVLFEITSPHRHVMPFSVEAAGAKSFAGGIDSPGWSRVRVVMADAKSGTGTVVNTSPALDELLSCEPPRISPWVDESSAAVVGTTRISALSELPAHLGEYACRNGLLESPVVTTALQNLLASEYEEYLDDIRNAGCGPVMERGAWIVMARSRPFSESWRTSVLLVDPQTTRVYLFWHPAYSTLAGRIYGPQPTPRDVSTIIVDELTLNVGHIFTVSWRERGVQIEPRSAGGASRDAR